MLDINTFAAPWSRSLKITTIAISALLSVIFILGVFVKPLEWVQWKIETLAVPITIIGISAFFSIRSYRIYGHKLYIQRAGWNSTIDLSQLESVEVDPRAMSKSIRLFGNGGLFCFAGLFRNKRLGNYRAFATNPKNSVILRFPKRVVVVTPEDPQGFVELVKTMSRF